MKTLVRDTAEPGSPFQGDGRSIMGSAAHRRAAVETGRIGRPADKREFLPRFRPTIAGAATGAGMRDDLTALCAAFAEEYGQGPMEARTAIEGLAQHGTITPREAEEWAREAGEAPFAEEPNPTEFDPKAAVYWTLGMATAWVLWRTDDAVRDEWETFISRRWRWMPYNQPEARATAPGGRVNVKGHVARTEEPHGAWGVIRLAAMFPTVLRMQIEDTEREMLAALQRGDLAAIQGDDEHVRAVPSMSWAGLSPFSPGRREQHDAVFARGNPHDPKLHHVKVKSADVMRLWSALDGRAPDEISGVVEKPSVSDEAPSDGDFVSVEGALAVETVALAGTTFATETGGAATEVPEDVSERNRARTARGRQIRTIDKDRRQAWVRKYVEENGRSIGPARVWRAYRASPGSMDVKIGAIKNDMVELRKAECKKNGDRRQ